MTERDLCYLLMGFFSALLLCGIFLAVSDAHAQGTRAVVVRPNGSVDIDWRAIPTCHEDICRAVAAARRGC